ncbi:MAG: signal recognition particle receptor subunit alpha, partial [Planctomycetota bacterium]
MFESITEALTGIFGRMRGKGRLSEKNIREGMREVRLALLEADVHYKVVKDFVRRVTEKAVGEEVIRSVTPAQQV